MKARRDIGVIVGALVGAVVISLIAHAYYLIVDPEATQSTMYDLLFVYTVFIGGFFGGVVGSVVAMRGRRSP